ncbi:hypothetical protein FA15DRAFT_549397, partial [Coprinopsis marcescibilis]
YPFPNLNAYLIADWFWNNDHGKSQKGFDQLLEIIGNEEFKSADVRKLNWAQINRVLTEEEQGGSSQPHTADSEFPGDQNTSTRWECASITIDVPFNSRSTKPGSHPFTVPKFYYRPLVSAIRTKLENLSFQDQFHFLPHELYWKPHENSKSVRVYGELYTSDAFIEAHNALLESAGEPGCNLPRYVVGMMFSSDKMRLGAFGNAEIWPLYLFFGNDSKYRRGKPSLKLGEQIAYFNKLPDSFKDFVLEKSGKPNMPQPLQTFCERELFHSQWRSLLDDEFLVAYEHGIIVEGVDKQKRRFYPRIFTYSADYLEKIVIATIRNLGKCPCPRCLIPLDEVHNLGTVQDRNRRATWRRRDTDNRRDKVEAARNLIYSGFRSVNSSFVEARLSAQSWVPVKNAFSDRLSQFGFDLFPMLVVDVMHEVELGVWKNLFTHLLRLLQALTPGAINTIDLRYCSTPTFGRDTIRKFSENVSDMKQLAARDFEDMLQCAIPAFDGLFEPKHNVVILKLIFTFSHWHGLAKLRMHTDNTLAELDKLTTELGSQMRGFIKNTCKQVKTTELPREVQKRVRAQTAQAAISKPLKQTRRGRGGRKDPKVFNISTYKFHALGDVVRTIKAFGTTDSYSTQVSELYHRHLKRAYNRTNKKDVKPQLARINLREARMRRIEDQILSNHHYESHDSSINEEDIDSSSYSIGRSQNIPVDLDSFLGQNANDPAISKFYLKLRCHLLPRILRLLIGELKTRATIPQSDRTNNISILQELLDQYGESDLDTMPASILDRIYIQEDRIYRHHVLNINYTTYDLRRDQDILNPNTDRRDIMCLRSIDPLEEEAGILPSHDRYIYGRILGVYHASVAYGGPGMIDLQSRRIDFLWVRWYDSIEGSATNESLERVCFPPLSRSGSTAFLDPDSVLRACHIIPRFSEGRKSKKSRAQTPDKPVSRCAGDHDDWKEYYINRFVDRDMVMRYMWGVAPGHLH